MEQMKKIMITGSNGLLGQKLIDKIIGKAGTSLLASSIGRDRHPAQGEGYIYQSLDITNRVEVLKTLQEFKPDVVIHTAAMTNVDQCESEKELCQKMNVDAVSYFIEGARELDFHFIHLSTDFIFDGENGPYAEDAPASPISTYGRSKAEAEQLLLRSEIRFAILRTIIVYGIAAEMSRSNIVLWAKAALEKGEKINVVNDQFRMPTLAEDLADACILAYEKGAQGIFNASGKDYMSIYELVQRVAAFFKLDASIINETTSEGINQAAKRPPRTGFILDKSISVLGYQPHSFEEGLAILQKQLVK